jgi:hypothetical protein
LTFSGRDVYTNNVNNQNIGFERLVSLHRLGFKLLPLGPKRNEKTGKTLTLIFTSSGIREGAIPYLHISDYSHVKKEGHLVAGRLQVYSGDPERYVTFITPEACIANSGHRP